MQGTVVAELTPQGAGQPSLVTYEAAYRPYGQQALGVPQAGPGYTGHVNDPDSGLVYMQARYYDPDGRFLSVDPVGPTPGNIFSFNRYAYANNNPIVNVDPNGRQATVYDKIRNSPCQGCVLVPDGHDSQGRSIGMYVGSSKYATGNLEVRSGMFVGNDCNGGDPKGCSYWGLNNATNSELADWAETPGAMAEIVGFGCFAAHAVRCTAIAGAVGFTSALLAYRIDPTSKRLYSILKSLAFMGGSKLTTGNIQLQIDALEHIGNMSDIIHQLKQEQRKREREQEQEREREREREERDQGDQNK